MKKGCLFFLNFFFLSILCYPQYITGDFFENVQPEKYDISSISTIHHSPDKKYSALTEGNAEYLVILDKWYDEIFRFKWDAVKTYYTWSDTVYIQGWSSDSRYLWFISWTPTNIAYIAKVDLILKHCTFYESPRLDEAITDYQLDCDTGIFYYSNYHNPPDDETRQHLIDKEYSLYVYKLFSHQIFQTGTKRGSDFLK